MRCDTCDGPMVVVAKTAQATGDWLVVYSCQPCARQRVVQRTGPLQPSSDDDPRCTRCGRQVDRFKHGVTLCQPCIDDYLLQG